MQWAWGCSTKTGTQSRPVPQSLWNKFKTVSIKIGTAFSGAFDKVKNAAKTALEWVGDKLSWLNDKIEHPHPRQSVQGCQGRDWATPSSGKTMPQRAIARARPRVRPRQRPEAIRLRRRVRVTSSTTSTATTIPEADTRRPAEPAGTRPGNRPRPSSALAAWQESTSAADVIMEPAGRARRSSGGMT